LVEKRSIGNNIFYKQKINIFSCLILLYSLQEVHTVPKRESLQTVEIEVIKASEEKYFKLKAMFDELLRYNETLNDIIQGGNKSKSDEKSLLVLSQEIEKLNDLIRLQEKEIEKLERNNIQYQEKIKQGQNQLEEIVACNEKLNLILEDLQKSSKIEKEKDQSQIENLILENDRIEEIVTKQSGKLAELAKEFEELRFFSEQERNQLKSEKVHLIGKIEDCEIYIKNLEEKVESLIYENSKCEEKIKELERGLKTIEADNKLIRLEVSGLEKRNNELSEELSALSRTGRPTGK
jgi:chromosome segregation ATPase